MREFKFRAWNKIKEEMMCLGQAHKKNLIGIDFQSYYIRSEYSDIILMQYSGLKDINNKEIYEGDLCRGIDDGGIVGPYKDQIIEIIFYKGAFRDDYFRGNISDYKHLEVLGNRYENTNLFKLKV